MLDITTVRRTFYMKYTRSIFYKTAYDLCPNIHSGDLYCNICEGVVEALEKAYQAGVSYAYWKQQQENRK